jgi:hypothetical protein
MKFEKLGQSGRARRGRLTLEHGRGWEYRG